MNNPQGVSPNKGKQGTTRGKEKIFWPRWEYWSHQSLPPTTEKKTTLDFYSETEIPGLMFR